MLDPAFAPGTGTPEAGGLTSAQLLEVLRGLDGLDVVGADVVEVSPAYDHAELTGVAAAHVAYDLIGLMTDLQASREPFEIVTGKRIYEDMLFKSIGVTTDKITENVLAVSCTFQQVIIVDVVLTTVPPRAMSSSVSEE